jgi:cell division protein FtsB
MNGLTPPFQVRAEYDKRHQQEKEKMMRSIFRNLLASILFLLIVLGWFGDSLLSVLIGRPRLSFQEVYGSWKNHLLRQRLAENGRSYRLG